MMPRIGRRTFAGHATHLVVTPIVVAPVLVLAALVRCTSYAAASEAGGTTSCVTPSRLSVQPAHLMMHARQARGVVTVLKSSPGSGCAFVVERLELTDGGQLEWWAGQRSAVTAEDVVHQHTKVSDTVVKAGAYSGNYTLRFGLAVGTPCFYATTCFVCLRCVLCCAVPCRAVIAVLCCAQPCATRAGLALTTIWFLHVGMCVRHTGGHTVGGYRPASAGGCNHRHRCRVHPHPEAGPRRRAG